MSKFASIGYFLMGLFFLFIRLFLMNDPSEYSKELRERVSTDELVMLVYSIFLLIVGFLLFLNAYYTSIEPNVLKDLNSFLKATCFHILLFGIVILYYKENIFLHLRPKGMKFPKDITKYRVLMAFIGGVLTSTGSMLIIWYYVVPYISKYYLIGVD